MCRVFLIAIFGMALSAQVVDPQYQAWMKSMQPSLATIRNAPDNAAMVEAANKLAATFDQVAMYWKAKQTADAVGFAETARDAAKAIAAGNGARWPIWKRSNSSAAPATRPTDSRKAAIAIRIGP